MSSEKETYCCESRYYRFFKKILDILPNITIYRDIRIIRIIIEKSPLCAILETKKSGTSVIGIIVERHLRHKCTFVIYITFRERLFFFEIPTNSV